MKKQLVIVLMLSILLTGCAGEQGSAEALVTTGAGVSETMEDTARTEAMETAGEASTEPLTIEAVKALAEKGEALVIEDFAPYLDLSPLREEGSLWETLEFSYQGVNMCLRVGASDKNLVSAQYEGELDSAIVFRKDFLELDTVEKEYAYDGGCGDIRSGNLEHILDGTVEMSDYMTVTLPEGLTESRFRHWLGSRGGVAFLRAGEQDGELSLENAGMDAGNPVAGGIEIWGNGDVGQSMSCIEELEPLELGQVTLRRGLWQRDEGANWYLAYTDREGSTIAYWFYLNADEYTKEEFLAATETIQLQERAIY